MSANLKILFALTLVHFTGDFYSSFINPLFPIFVDKLDLSLTQVGIIAGVIRMMAFIIQPSVGYLADRYPTRIFIFTGLSLAVIFIPLSGLAPNFWVLLFCVTVGSIGSAMFHPSVTGMIPLYAGRHAGFSMSIFNTGGTLAFGLGPLFITWVVATFGLSAMPATMIIGLLVIGYLLVVIPQPQSEGLKDFGFLGAIKQSLGDAWKPVSLIWLVMFLRAVVGQSFLTFMPVLFVQQGFSVVAAGGIYAVFLLAGTVSGLLSGHISDRIGFKPVLLFVFLLMPPALWLLLGVGGAWVYLGAVVAGGFVLAPLPLGVTMAQTLAPRGRSMVASLMMGFAYGLGGLTTPLIGKLADIYTIKPVLTAMAAIPLLAVAVITLLPRTKANG
ncbi:MFS transporter [Desulfofustis glycolicus]|uniref:MFS transporter, FSR family, fosmidomycin resistance protein n=1 Tax=Desulfofustis glycolicus DSM 9705 TaxID=1121409 RepID=A0A1M5V5V2_9BACT|nr:MFS transporter [Desulfofustis glycolicus]MCB2214970.1 MFS transporter [Desulfobulbaceae bacterium]SHH70619.1 MFS transporter, FSR family, fosmidomycin resistance protein [Desulfofustis glycolicus DSM 9705]